MAQQRSEATAHWSGVAGRIGHFLPGIELYGLDRVGHVCKELPRTRDVLRGSASILPQYRRWRPGIQCGLLRDCIPGEEVWERRGSPHGGRVTTNKKKNTKDLLFFSLISVHLWRFL